MFEKMTVPLFKPNAVFMVTPKADDEISLGARAKELIETD